jgi:hypothetical protein
MFVFKRGPYFDDIQNNLEQFKQKNHYKIEKKKKQNNNQKK